MEVTDVSSLVGSFASGMSGQLWAVAALAVPIAAAGFIAPKAIKFFKKVSN